MAVAASGWDCQHLRAGGVKVSCDDRRIGTSWWIAREIRVWLTREMGGKGIELQGTRYGEEF